MRSLRGLSAQPFWKWGNRESTRSHTPTPCREGLHLAPAIPARLVFAGRGHVRAAGTAGYAGPAPQRQHPSCSSSFGGGVIVHRAVCSWLCPPSLSTVQPAARMAGACLVSCPDADCAPFGQPAGGGNRARQFAVHVAEDVLGGNPLASYRHRIRAAMNGWSSVSVAVRSELPVVVQALRSEHRQTASAMEARPSWAGRRPDTLPG